MHIRLNIYVVLDFKQVNKKILCTILSSHSGALDDSGRRDAISQRLESFNILLLLLLLLLLYLLMSLHIYIRIYAAIISRKMDCRVLPSTLSCKCY
jgi:hypothetical protein